MRKANGWYRGLAAACVAVVLVCGCHGPKVEHVGPEGRLIGHGLNFEYVLPADGRVYIVRDDKVVFMRVMRKGDKFEALGPAGPDDQGFERNKYYFEPAPQPDK